MTAAPARLRSRRHGLAAAAVALLAAACTPGAAWREPAGGNGAPPADPGAVATGRLTVDGRERRYRLYTPASAARPAPLVLVFHGSGGDGARIRRFVGRDLERLADRHGFVVAYPDGVEGNWNDCRAGARFPAKTLGVDDVGFVRALVRHLTGVVDPRRAYALGFSNGGHMAFRLALEAPGEVAAVAAFGANLPAPAELACRLSGTAVPVMVVNGTADRINPYDGGTVRLPDGSSLGDVVSAAETARYFARLWPAARLTEEPVLAAGPAGLGVDRQRWRHRDRDRVVLYTIVGGGHTIPSPHGRFPAFLGAVERRFDALAVAVRFFEAAPDIQARQ